MYKSICEEDTVTTYLLVAVHTYTGTVSKSVLHPTQGLRWIQNIMIAVVTSALHVRSVGALNPMDLTGSGPVVVAVAVSSSMVAQVGHREVPSKKMQHWLA